jgi:hypothetical protein
VSTENGIRTTRYWTYATFRYSVPQVLEFRTPLFPHLVPPAIMVWIFVWKYIFEPFIHILQHFVLQLSRSTNFCFYVQLPFYLIKHEGKGGCGIRVPVLGTRHIGTEWKANRYFQGNNNLIKFKNVFCIFFTFRRCLFKFLCVVFFFNHL